ncbi:MAG: hypothetical protein Kow0069_17990 [Promethearchaeota archaeon]
MALEKWVVTTKGFVRADYAYWVGKYMDKFYDALAQQKVVADKCPKCGKVFVPPRKVCGECFATVPLDDDSCWVELPPRGTLVNFTATSMTVTENRTRKKSALVGMVKLEGADTALVYPVLGAKESDLSLGARVEIQWNTKVKGQPADIRGFRLVDGGEA